MTLLILLTVLAVCCPSLACGAGLQWAPGRLLPAFSSPASELDCVDLTGACGDEVDLCASLQGLVNREQPRLASVSRRSGEGKFTWLKLHKLNYRMIGLYDAIVKYRTNFTGLVATDPDQPDTLNLATTIAGVNDELIAGPDLLSILTNAPYRIPIVDDLRGRFADKYAVYGFLYTNYWPLCTHRIVAGMGTQLHGCLRDYLVATKAATLWLGPGVTEDAHLLRLFVKDMPPVGGVYMGWWPGEGDGLEWIAKFAIPVLASDFFCNATVFSGVPGQIHIPPIPELPSLQNKIYLALILSDGDNIQYMQHVMKMDWDKHSRGAIPIGWTVSPLSLELDPGMLNYYWSTATTNDCLIAGPSGVGYAHVNHWAPDMLAAFTKLSAPYLQRSGLRVLTVWDRVTPEVARAFAANCPGLLGLTDQSGTYGKTNLGLRTIRLTPTYTSTVREMVSWINDAASGWDGKSPLFLAAQANVWNMSPDELIKAVRALDSSKYMLVRPDQLFLLADQSRPSN